MALGYMDDSYLINIADAIREKNGKIAIVDTVFEDGDPDFTITIPKDGSYYMAGTLCTIAGIADETLVNYENSDQWIYAGEYTVSINWNGYLKIYGYTFTPDDMPEVIRSIKTSEDIVLQDKNYSVTSNGTYTIQEDDGYGGMSSVNLTVNINNAPKLQAKTVFPSATTQIVTADSGYDGLSQVTVNGDSDLTADNIKKGVLIFGITGTYEGSSSSKTYIEINTYELYGNSPGIIGDLKVNSVETPCAEFIWGNTQAAIGSYITFFIDSNTSFECANSDNTSRTPEKTVSIEGGTLYTYLVDSEPMYISTYTSE